MRRLHTNRQYQKSTIPLEQDDDDPSGTLLADRRRMCRFCNKLCSSSSALLYHTRLHTGERPYVCQYCKKGFIQKVHLQRHVENNHENVGGNRNNNILSTSFAPSMVSSAIAAFSPSSSLRASSGNRLTTSPTMVRRARPVGGNRLEAVANHLKMARVEQTKVELLERVYERHPPTVAPIKLEPPTISDHDDQQQQQQQQQHPPISLRIKRRQPPTPTTSQGHMVQCSHCDRTFGGQIAYLEHVYEAHQDRTENPEEIPVELAADDGNDEKSANSRNYTNSSSSTSSSTWCYICSKRLPSAIALAVHMKAHSGGRSFHCTQCDKTFQHQNSLKIHLMSHSGLRPHVCKVCSKSFTTSRTLKIHSMIHSGERPYSCKFCQRQFIQQIHLLRHIKSHIRRGSSSSFGIDATATVTTSPPPVIKNSSAIQTSSAVTTDNHNDSIGKHHQWSPSDGTFADSSTSESTQGDEATTSNNHHHHSQAKTTACLNCHLFEHELAQLKNEIVQLKQLLGVKLTLMESKISGMQRCLARSASPTP